MTARGPYKDFIKQNFIKRNYKGFRDFHTKDFIKDFIRRNPLPKSKLIAIPVNLPPYTTAAMGGRWMTS